MVPTKVTDFLPGRLADWLTGRRRPSTANGSIPADTEPPAPDREEDRQPPPPAKRARYDLSMPTFFAQPELAPPPTRVESLEPFTAFAGPSGVRPDVPSTSATQELRWQRDINVFSQNRSVSRHNLGSKEDSRRKETPLAPVTSPVRQTTTLAGSPFYPGRTRYGGAGATYIDEPNIRERRRAVPSQPLCTIDNSISATTRRLMGILERCSTPSYERRPPQVRTNASMSSANSSLLGRSIAGPSNSNRTTELQISHLPTLLKLKQGARMRESTRAARRTADLHSPTFAPYPPPVAAAAASTPSLDTVSQDNMSTHIRELTKQTNKIKSQIGKSARKGAQSATIESEVAPALNLPEVSLQIDQSNLPKFSFTPPAQIKKPETTTATSKAPSFKFPMPEIVTCNHTSIPADTGGFKFSEPYIVEEKKLTNGPRSFGTSTPVQPLKAAVSVDWKCDDCWVQNKESDDKCCACTALRPSKKADKPAVKDWQCKDCWVYNKDHIDHCIACGWAKPKGVQTDNKISETTTVISQTPLVKSVAKEWRCNDCWVQNKDEIFNCVACGGKKPGASVEKPAVKKDWQCGDCWVFNKYDVGNCIACGGTKPGDKQAKKVDSFVGLTQKKSNKWTCNDCWVSNEESAQQCIACGGANPKKASTTPAKNPDLFSDLVKKQNEKWECPSCLTRNNDSVSKCICCESVRPGSKKEDTKFNFSATPAFKFGIPANTESKDKNESIDPPIESNNNTHKSVTFTFGVQKSTDDKKDKTPFTFGVPKPTEDKTVSNEKEPPKFPFGTSSTSTEKPTFKFGALPIESEAKSDVDASKAANLHKTEKETAFKLPTMGSSGFTFNATPSKETPKTTVSVPTTTIPVLFGVAKTTESSSGILFNASNASVTTTANTLFGISSTAKTEISKTSSNTLHTIPSNAITDSAASSEKHSSTLFGISPAKTVAPASTTTSSLFGMPPTGTTEAQNVTSTLFVSPATTKTDGNTSGSTLFGMPTAKTTASNASGTLFGVASTTNKEAPSLFGTPAKPGSTNVVPSPTTSFSSTNSEAAARSAAQAALFTFGTGTTQSTPSKFNFSLGHSATADKEASSFNFISKTSPTLGSSTTQSSLLSLGTSITQSNSIPSFGSFTTQANTTNSFGTATTQAPVFGSLTSSSVPAFGSTAPAFGSSSTTPAFGAPTAQLPAFGTTTAQPAFGTTTNQAPAFVIPTTKPPAFGSQTNSPAFGTPTTQPTLAFGTPTGSAPSFGATGSAVPAFGASQISFGTPTTQPTFGTPTTQAATFAPPNVNLFADQGGARFGSNANQNKTFTFGANSNTNTMFGQPTTQQPLQFGGSNPSNQSMFNSQPANPASMGMFSSTTPAFGSSNQSQSAPSQPQAFNFGSPSVAPVFNFGQASAQPTPGAFNFGASSAPNVQFNLGSSSGTPQSSATARRPVRRAVRRTQR